MARSPRWATRVGTGLVALLAVTAWNGCSSKVDAPLRTVEPKACRGDAFEGSPLSIRCGALVDEHGREVRLHGINARVEGLFDVSFDDGRVALETIPAFTKADATNIRGIGFNALRLPLNWSGLEPTETGGFVKAYICLLYTSPSPRDRTRSRMPSSA